MKIGIATLGDSLALFKIMLNIFLPYDSAFVLLAIYPKELKTYALKKCRNKFIANLLIIAKAWKQPKCPSMGE